MSSFTNKTQVSDKVFSKESNTELSLQLIQKISQSKYSVYQVYSHNDKKHYALKLFPHCKDLICVAYLLEERFSDLNHPNVISVISKFPKMSFHTSENKLADFSCILSELAPYESLEKFFFSNKLYTNEVLVRTYFRQLISGIEYIHSKGIAHLDLKPQNLVIGDNFVLKIIDFDNAYQTGDLFVFSQGSADYRAPELLSKTCKKPMAADIYSAGIILFILRYGTFPYIEEETKGNDLFQLMEDKSEGFWKYHRCLTKNKHINDETQGFKDLFHSMTRRNPSHRATILDIKKSNWYQGPIYSTEEVIDLITKRCKIKSLAR